MAKQINLKNRGPSPFEFEWEGSRISISSRAVGGPFNSTVCDVAEIRVALASGVLVPSVHRAEQAVAEEETIAVGPPSEDASPKKPSDRKRRND